MQPPSGETLALFASLFPEEAQTPPLLAERVRRDWTRGEVVDWIRERFAIEEGKREKVARYWHELETGLLPAGRVSAGLGEWVAERFGRAWQHALRWEPPAVRAEHRIALLRVQDAPELLASMDVPAPAPPVPAPEPDEVDRLFGTR